MAILKRRAETNLLIDRLCKMEDGEILTYSEAMKITGLSMDKTKQLLRTTARKEAEAKTLRIYATQVSIGIRRLPPNESPEEIDSYNRRIQNHAKAGLKRSKNVDYENMDKGSREQLNFARTMMAITKNTYSKEQIEQVKAKVKQAERPLGMIDILDHFREK